MLTVNPFGADRRYSPPPSYPLPHLLSDRLASYRWLIEEGLEEVLQSVSPIQDENQAYRYSIRLRDASLDDPAYSADECRALRKTYAAMLRCTASMALKSHRAGGEIIKETRGIALAQLPLMTETGSFVVNGTDRVAINQIVRSPGLVFMSAPSERTGQDLAQARIIPRFGVWVRFAFDDDGRIWAVIDQKTRLSATTLLFALGAREGAIEREFAACEGGEQAYAETLSIDKAMSREQAIERWFTSAFRGERATPEFKEERIERFLQNPLTYDLGKTGRMRLDLALSNDPEEQGMLLSLDDLYRTLRGLVDVQHGRRAPDDQDHMRYRRIRTPGELVQNSVRIGLKQMDYVIRTNRGAGINENANIRQLMQSPLLSKSLNQFFTSGLTQLLDQTNPLAEVAHKRRITALGPGGVDRGSAGLDMRDVHRSHYGRICPVESPEGANCGIVNALANYARIDDHGFIGSPYHKVMKTISAQDPDILGRTVLEDVERFDGAGYIVKRGSVVTPRMVKALAELPPMDVTVTPYIKDDLVEYLSPDEEDGRVVAQSNSVIDAKGQLFSNVEYRRGLEVGSCLPAEADYMDVSALQCIGSSASLIPFLEHDDITRALMGANMQRQAVPSEQPELAFINTGMEAVVAQDSGYVVQSPMKGKIARVSPSEVIVESDNGEARSFKMTRTRKQNGGHAYAQRPADGISQGEFVDVGQTLIDGPSTKNGELALGHNMLVAFMCWDGYNYEDSLLVSEGVVRDNRFTSTHIETHRVFVCDNRSGGDGPEEITRNLPDMAEDAPELRALDDNGLPQVGAWLNDGDVIVGVAQRRLDIHLSNYARFIKALRGDGDGQQTRTGADWRDLSQRMAHGHKGRIIDVQVVTVDSDQDDELVSTPGAHTLVKVTIARRKHLMEGDKMAGRHGNKGIVSRIMRQEDMPYLEDGTPVDICVTPIGVPSRMNLGQILEVHLGLAAAKMGFRAFCSPFSSASVTEVEDALAQAWFIDQSGASKSLLTEREKLIDMRVLWDWLREHGYEYDALYEGEVGAASAACLEIWLRTQMGCDTSTMSEGEMREYALRLDRLEHKCAPVFAKQTLYDGRTGEKYDRPVTVGIMYMIKLNHLVEHKVHARSTGPYALLTAQPVGGKALFGGQRHGRDGGVGA